LQQQEPQNSLTKVPEITAAFWVTKVATTAMGEATSDALNQHPGPYVAAPLMLLALGLALRLQFRKSRYTAWSYWLVVTMVAVFGTTAADALHVVLGIPYTISTSFYAVVLASVFVAWYRSERTLSIHSIRTKRRETFYWATVLSTFALGTAAGDLTATTMRLGFLASAVMFAALIAVPALAWRYLELNAIVAFWAAYVLTRPLGASVADWLENRRDGLGLGAGPVAAGLTVAVVALVAYLMATRNGERVDRPPGTHSRTPLTVGLEGSDSA
jgi:uncharacterized membrane-anchored protein